LDDLGFTELHRLSADAPQQAGEHDSQKQVALLPDIQRRIYERVMFGPICDDVVR
jgi:hypothetical protein